MLNVTIIDTETSGIDPSKDRVVEVGAILYSLDHFVDIASFSTLIRCDGQSAETEKINRIPSAALPGAAEADVAWNQIRTFVGLSKAVLAHGAEFDRSFVPEDLRTAKPWICTNNDIEWPEATSARSLIAITLAHGLGVSHAHRALCDCDMISRLLTRCHERGHDVKAMLRRGLRPKGTFQALVSIEDKDQAKNAGFRWEPSDQRIKNPQKRWVRTMAIEDAAKLPFKTARIDRCATSTDPLFDPVMASWNEGATP